jgi:hypothetical protein
MHKKFYSSRKSKEKEKSSIIKRKTWAGLFDGNSRLLIFADVG